MVADIRAKISCSLGEVISGNWSDEALAVGQGLIRCRGQIILRGIVVPTAGTIVKLAYVRDGQLAKVPRVLRVLSSFADPLRQITTVQLGDKLVWLEQKKQGYTPETINYPPNPQPGDPLNTPLPYPAPEFGTGLKIERRVYNGICWKKEIINADDEFAFDWANPGVAPWEQNPDRLADEALKAPVTISARAIMAKCLAALALTSTGIPLASQYEENAVDLKNGYVAALEQLLSAESYVGYLDEQERLVINPTKPEEVTSGPVVREVDIIDIGPIGSGELPIDDPVVEFEELKPKEPPKQPEPVAPVAPNFIGGSSYNGDVVTLPSGLFTGSTWFDPVRTQLGGIRALYSVSGGTGGSVEQTAQGVVFTPEQGFNGTANFTYQVTDGYQLSNSATVYIRVSTSSPSAADLLRDLAEKPPTDPVPPEPPPNLSGTAWSYDDGSTETLTIPYTATGGTKGVAVYTYQPSSSTREVLNSRGNVYYKEERQKTGRAPALGSALQRYLEQGSEPDVNGTVTTVTVTQSTYRVIDDNSGPQEKPPLTRNACIINGECPADLSLPEDPTAGATHRYGECDYYYNGLYWQIATGTIFDPDTSQNPRFSLREAKDRGLAGDAEEEKTRDVITTYEPGEVAIGALNWPEGVLPPLTTSPYIGEQIFTEYYRDRTKGITRTVTTRYTAAYKLPEGQQQLAAQGDTYATFGGTEDWLRSATRLLFAGQTSSTRYDVNYGLAPGTSATPEKPTPTSPNAPNEPSTSPPTPVNGTTGNEPGTPDLSLPLTPAAPKTWDPDNGYQERWDDYQRHNARVLALRYARAQRAIAYGNRYGMSLQVVPWSVPRYPLEALYLDLAGVVGAYRTNGITVAFDSNGVVANVDALLVGGVGGTGTPYYPVPSTVTTLPPPPSSTLNPGVVPWSSIPVPPDFDPAAPGDALDTIPSRDVVEYPETLAPDFIIPPAATTVTAVRGVRVGLRCKRLDYDVTPLEREVAIGVTVGHEVIPDYGDAPAGWTPAALSLTAWYDAGTPSDFTLDTGSVSQWNDRSGNSRHMSQSTGSAKPAYASATQNSLNLVTFDGTNDYLAASALSNFITASTFTIFAVVRHRGTSVGNSDTYNNRAIIADDAGYVGLHTNGPSGTGSIRILAYNWDGTDDSVSHTIGADNVWSIIAYTHSGGSIESRRNGGAAVSVSSGDTEDIAGILELGRAGVVGLYLEMDLAEVVIMNTAVNSTDRQKLEGYAAHRWGLTADLPSDHPYKSTAP